VASLRELDQPDDVFPGMLVRNSAGHRRTLSRSVGEVSEDNPHIGNVRSNETVFVIAVMKGTVIGTFVDEMLVITSQGQLGWVILTRYTVVFQPPTGAE
jgi:hypothetical protein